MSWNWDDNYTFEQFREKFGRNDCVYGWFRGEECLYIGVSSSGPFRVWGHNKIDRIEPAQPDDYIRFIWNPADCLLLESILIEHYAPKYNGNGGCVPVKSNRPLQTLICPSCKRPFKQSRWWQKTCRNKCAFDTKKNHVEIPPGVTIGVGILPQISLSPDHPNQETKTS